MLMKAGVDISRLKRPMRRALKPLDNLYKRHDNEFVITSTYEGNHGADSLHYAHLAIDGRKLKKNPGPETVMLIKHAIGPNFDVIWHRNHIHIEHDPK